MTETCARVGPSVSAAETTTPRWSCARSLPKVGGGAVKVCSGAAAGRSLLLLQLVSWKQTRQRQRQLWGANANVSCCHWRHVLDRHQISRESQSSPGGRRQLGYPPGWSPDSMSSPPQVDPLEVVVLWGTGWSFHVSTWDRGTFVECFQIQPSTQSAYLLNGTSLKRLTVF